MTAYPLGPSIERVSSLPVRKAEMDRKKSTEPSSESIARANRQRLAHEEGIRAMADIEQQGIAVRKNMERLRALREASEALAADTGSNPVRAPARKRKKTVRT